MACDSDISILRKKLYYKATRRGSKELDMLFKYIVTNHLPTMNEKLLSQFENLLNHKDLDIYRQFMGYQKLEDSLNNELWQLLKEFKA